MTTQQTDIEKTLKRILARGLEEWPEGAVVAYQSRFDSEIYFDDPYGDGINNCYLRSGISAVDPLSGVTRAEWEAERARIAKDKSDFAEHIGKIQDSAFASALDELKDSLLDVKYEQKLWDKVAISFIGGSAADQRATWTERGTKEIVEQASNVADAFMAERAKRIAARKEKK